MKKGFLITIIAITGVAFPLFSKAAGLANDIQGPHDKGDIVTDKDRLLSKAIDNLLL